MLSPWANGMGSAQQQRQGEQPGRQQQQQQPQLHQQEPGAKQARQHDAHAAGRPKHGGGSAANGKARPAPVHQHRGLASTSGAGGKALEAGKARSSGNDVSATTTTVAMRLLPSDCFEN